MSNEAPTPGETPLEPIDWDRLDSKSRTVPRRLIAFVVGLVAMGALYRHTSAHHVGVLIPWEPTMLTWLYRVSLLTLACFGLPPLVRNTARTGRYWRRFRGDRVAVVCLAYLIVFVLLATVGATIVGHPSSQLGDARQPPVLFGAKDGLVVSSCVGPVVEGYCRGTLSHPLGTNALGQDMIALIVNGMHVSFQVAVITAVLMIPVATVVGLVAGYVGGFVDDALMRYVDVQQSVPAFVVYLILVFVIGPSLFAYVVVFGLLNWGSIARLVRSEVIQRREEGYIEAAKSAGVSRLTILRTHLLPNVSNTILVGATKKVPQIVLLETALTFIGLGDVGRWYLSFGDTINSGFHTGYTDPINVWWVWTVPVVALVITIVALSIVGDTLRDVYDPRGDV